MELNTKYSLVSSHSHHPHPGLFTGLLKFLIFFSEVQVVHVYGWEAFHFFLCHELSCQSARVIRSQNPCELQTIVTRLHQHYSYTFT